MLDIPVLYSMMQTLGYVPFDNFPNAQKSFYNADTPQSPCYILQGNELVPKNIIKSLYLSQNETLIIRKYALTTSARRLRIIKNNRIFLSVCFVCYFEKMGG